MNNDITELVDRINEECLIDHQNEGPCELCPDIIDTLTQLWNELQKQKDSTTLKCNKCMGTGKNLMAPLNKWFYVNGQKIAPPCPDCKPTRS